MAEKAKDKTTTLQSDVAGGRPQRQRREVSRLNRSDIYYYDTVRGQDNSENELNQNENQNDQIKDVEDDDDSFIYSGSKFKKTQQKNKKAKAKSQKNMGPVLTTFISTNKKDKQISQENVSNSGRNKKNKGSVDNIPDPKAKAKKKEVEQEPKGYYVQYYHPQAGSKGKQVQQIKIFNPELHIENIQNKAKYEKQLDQLYEQYGKKIPKYQQPTFNNISWKYLLRQIEQAGKDFAAEREERIKLKKKVCKFAQNTWNRMEQINQQRIKQEERKIRKQSLELMRHVKRQYWGSAMKVRKVIHQQQRKKSEKQYQMKKLEELVAKQFDASQKITTILQGYEEVSLNNIQVSQLAQIPVVIDIETKPKYKFVGLHEDNVIRPSLLIKFPLRQYQLLGVHWMSTLHSRGMNAILADEMGLGKTIQTISLLAHLAIDKGIWGPHLVIVPTTILMNWQIQFKRWCPAFKIMTYFGSPKQRQNKRKGWSKLNSFHVCITSYKIAVTDYQMFRRKKWYYMILDQAQNIKNFKSQRYQILLNFKTKYRLLLTGTPLQNDLTELWSLLHFLMPKIFDSFDDFNEWFNIPFQQALQKNFPISQQILKKLHTILRPFFLRRMKKDVEKQLPTKQERIIRCSMSRRQRYLYDEMIWHENKKQKMHESAGMMNVLMGLKKICNHPDLFQPRIQESPLNWIPLTVVIAHHMFLKLHFQTYKIHILKDFVERISTTFEQVAQDILKTYDQLQINKDNRQFYKNKYMDRLFFAKINYQRSKRKQFKVYNFEFKDFEVYEQKVPYYMSKSIIQRAAQFSTVFDKFLFVVPKVMARPAHLTTFPMNSEVQAQINRLQYLRKKAKNFIPKELEQIRSRFLLHFPSKNIVLYDSGKLIKLVFLLKSIKYRNQKALVFTQMTKMLDIFEKVLNMFKFNYVRLDGSTKTQLRQNIVERFNNDPRVLCFISSTRSGGIGLNLTGASNVIFYDTDWNPAMDKQAQDRCHRIGQTRNVIIYRLITQYSIQENILMKSIQKRKLEQLVTQEGMFNTSYFEKVNLKEMLAGAIDYQEDDQANLAQVQDQQDRQMLQAAERESKQRKDDDQEQLQVQMLPKLFKFGLKMLQNDEFVQQMNRELSDEDLEQIDQQQQEQNQALRQQRQREQKLQEQKKKKDQAQNKRSTRGQKMKQLQKQTTDEKIQEQLPNLTSKAVKKTPNKQQPMDEIYEEQSQKEQDEGNQEIEPEQEIVQQPEQQENVVKHTHISTYERLKAMSIYQSQYQYIKNHYFYSDNIPIIQINEEKKDLAVSASTKPRNDKKKKRRR